ncbi:hypothetical protein C8R46DRAFT_1099265 [Mycena filopes]|nr:hypothetical protein C8R46DRAFT_1099265 [Mycena filopes]
MLTRRLPSAACAHYAPDTSDHTMKMLFAPLFLAFLAIAVAQPSPDSTVTKVEPLKEIDLSDKVPVQVKIISAVNNGTVFTFDGARSLEVLVPMRPDDPEAHFVWDRYQADTHAWVFRNRGTKQWLKVDEENNNHLITVVQFKPTIFAVEHAGEGEVVIKLPDTDSVWEAIYDGTSMMFGRVALTPARGSVYQQWKYEAYPTLDA